MKLLPADDIRPRRREPRPDREALAATFFAVGGAATLTGLTLFRVANHREHHGR
jgi:hypothetical protein